MSGTWNEGYFTDVGYTYGYYREINPVFQRFCLLLRGYAPVESANPVHCELGFGQGVSINIHAAANPGSYVGTDFNPAHAAHANSLAASYDNNPRLYDDSFEQLLARDDLPQFDSISLHGIWTWVSRDNHKLITEFVRRHLKPGGVLYNSYNCFPGWSPAAPLRQLFSLHDRFMPHANESNARIDSALKFAESLLGAKPVYAQTIAGLPERLKKIMEQNRQYIAHEYFNREWNCMYFTDVVEALEPAKVEYATTALPLDIVDAINLSQEGHAFLQGIENPLMREQARDYFVNQQFRKDIYTRGALRISVREQTQRLMESRFVLIKAADDVPTKVKGPIGEAQLHPEIYAPLIEALSSTAHTPKSIQQLIELAPRLKFSTLVEGLSVLVGIGVVEPCQSEAVENQVINRCRALNDNFLQQARLGKKIEFLASPVTGGGVLVDRFQQLFLLSVQKNKKQPAEWAQDVWALFSSQGERIVKNGKLLETAEENVNYLVQQADQFLLKHLDILKALRIC